MNNSVKKNTVITYRPAQIESGWQEKWQEEKIYSPDIENSKKPYFTLMMFPYPSAEGMHVGNMYAFTGTDIHGRFKRMQGYDVLEPIGLDGFGIHSENYALKIGKHPMDQAQIAEKNFYRQMFATGNGYAWDRRVETYAPNYYIWTQWLFIELFKSGLAYRKNAPVNFCPSCKTVLADEQVEDGKCERCSSVVERRDLEQWFFKITDYADQLLANIPDLNWSEKVKIAQKKWIGKSEGAEIAFSVEGLASSIKVFTTRPDTLYGATFLVVAPEHQFVKSIVNNAEVSAYLKASSKLNQQERMETARDKTGVFSGKYATHPLTGKKLPIWIADYVLMSYGTGAIMAVPAHDERDFSFAKQFDLPIIPVIKPEKEVSSGAVYTGGGILINSGELTGTPNQEAKKKIISQLEKKEAGSKAITYHLRDWLISRQRYWGAPIPMIFCEDCKMNNTSWFDTDEAMKYKQNKQLHITKETSAWAAGWYPVTQEQLPVELPYIEEYKPLGTGKSPLANYPDFYKTTCPTCGGAATRETDVCDTFLDSSWYFFRYTSTELTTEPFSEERVNKWLPVNMYIGGAEHSVLHLLYSRFVTMVLKDLGMITFDEPFSTFYAHGLLIKEGSKMSKSKGNVVIPDEYIKKYGADTLRTYLMFLGPYNMGGDFYDTGIEGIYKFLKRVWHAFMTNPITDAKATKEVVAERHSVIKGVTQDLEGLRYNTAIAKLMTYYNTLSKLTEVSKDDVETFLQLLAPFAPHMTEEIWRNKLQHKASIHVSSWPEYQEELLEQKDHIVAVQINGKLRGNITITEDILHDEKQVIVLAEQEDNVKKHLSSVTIKKTIYVPGKILNFVAS